MTETNVVIEKPQRIQELWGQLGRTKSNAPEYETLMKEIRVLSAEYQKLVEPVGSLQAQNNCIRVIQVLGSPECAFLWFRRGGTTRQGAREQKVHVCFLAVTVTST